MKTNQSIPILLALAVFTLPACDDSTSPPPSQGQGISKLSESPTSLPGRSAATGRNAARQITQDQDATVGVAGEITGETQVLNIGNLQWHPPSAWEKLSPRPMTTAVFRVAADTGSGEAQVTFSQAGGDIQSNIDRWRTQVSGDNGPADADVKDRTVAGVKVTMVSMDGTYKDMSGKENPGYGFRAAIVQAPSGNIFIKFTGPASVVGENQGAWETMVLGMRKP